MEPGPRFLIDTVTITDGRCVYDMIYAAPVDAPVDHHAAFDQLGQLRDGGGMEAYLRRSAWYGGLGLLGGNVVRNLALPPGYFHHVVREST